MTTRMYTVPVELTQWHTPSNGETVFNWDYDEGRDKLLSLYDKGKRLQWNAAERIDWSLEIDFENPIQVPDQFNPLYGTSVWDKMGEKDRVDVRRHMTAWQFSQFLHGEQGALICASKIVQTVPDLDSKYYAATQVMDEARHVEAYARYLRDKLQLAYPINPSLRTLLTQLLDDSRWDFTYLGMQILIEGLALASFGFIRDMSKDPLARQLNAYVIQDEARHVAFGRFALRDVYPQLTDAERLEREEFCVEACYLMRDRFLAHEVWDNLGIKNGAELVDKSASMQQFRRLLFSRIVPALKEIGLWGAKVQKAFVDMDVMEFADLDLDALAETDDQVAKMLDDQRRSADEGIASTIALAEGGADTPTS